MRLHSVAVLVLVVVFIGVAVGTQQFGWPVPHLDRILAGCACILSVLWLPDLIRGIREGHIVVPPVTVWRHSSPGAFWSMVALMCVVWPLMVAFTGFIALRGLF